MTREEFEAVFAMGLRFGTLVAANTLRTVAADMPAGPLEGVDELLRDMADAVTDGADQPVLLEQLRETGQLDSWWDAHHGNTFSEPLKRYPKCPRCQDPYSVEKHLCGRFPEARP